MPKTWLATKRTLLAHGLHTPRQCGRARLLGSHVGWASWSATPLGESVAGHSLATASFVCCAVELVGQVTLQVRRAVRLAGDGAVGRMVALRRRGVQRQRAADEARRLLADRTSEWVSRAQDVARGLNEKTTSATGAPPSAVNNGDNPELDLLVAQKNAAVGSFPEDHTVLVQSVARRERRRQLIIVHLETNEGALENDVTA